MQATLLPLPDGITILPNYLNRLEQLQFIELARKIVSKAPLVAPRMWSGGEFKVKVTSCGSFGWFSDESGYKYLTRHPVTRQPFPQMPEEFRELAQSCAGKVHIPDFQPDTCLINYYAESAKLGLHVDDTEEDLTSPIVTLSLGASCIFAVGGFKPLGQNSKDST